MLQDSVYQEYGIFSNMNKELDVTKLKYLQILKILKQFYKIMAT
jgi:hypothetical protein